MTNLETKEPHIATTGKNSFLKKLGSYKIVILGVIAILARNGLDDLAQKLIGDNYTFDEEAPYFEIEDFMSEEEINAMREYVFKGIFCFFLNKTTNDNFSSKTFQIFIVFHKSQIHFFIYNKLRSAICNGKRRILSWSRTHWGGCTCFA